MEICNTKDTSVIDSSMSVHFLPGTFTERLCNQRFVKLLNMKKVIVPEAGNRFCKRNLSLSLSNTGKALFQRSGI